VSVDFRRSEYESAVLDWTTVADVLEGARAVKSRGEQYLPRPNPGDKSDEAAARYQQYLARAVFVSFTRRTLDGLLGAAFRRWPTMVAPAGIDYIEMDVDGAGVNIYQQSQRVTSRVLGVGRHGLLVDFPVTDGIVSRAQFGQFRAHIRAIDAADVINWRTDIVGGVQRLSLVVIAERVEQPKGFEVEEIEQRRVLELVEGRYTVTLWRQSERGTWDPIEAYQPTDASGSAWDEIPFVFVGSENNDPGIDRAPMLPLADLNLAHYRNSADYEDSVFFVGQVQPYITGLTAEWRDFLEKSGLFIGSRSPILLPEGGNFGMVQAQPNMLAKEAMDAKEAQMIALGARLVEPGGAAKTATEASADSAAQHSVLSLVVNNVSDAYTKALGYVGRFQGADGDFEYTIASDFVEHKLEPQMLTALIQAWQSGRLPETDLWAQLRKHGVIDPSKTDEEISDELEMTGAGMVLDGDFADAG
jgi:hypothetical protein